MTHSRVCCWLDISSLFDLLRKKHFVYKRLGKWKRRKKNIMVVLLQWSSKCWTYTYMLLLIRSSDENDFLLSIRFSDEVELRKLNLSNWCFFFFFFLYFMYSPSLTLPLTNGFFNFTRSVEGDVDELPSSIVLLDKELWKDCEYELREVRLTMIDEEEWHLDDDHHRIFLISK
jgi:hypothetical protein